MKGIIQSTALLAVCAAVPCGCGGYSPRPAGFERAPTPAIAAARPMPAPAPQAAPSESSLPIIAAEATPAPPAEEALAIDPANPRPPNLDKLAGGAMTIEGFEPIHFDHDSAALPVTAVAVLRHSVEYLTRNPQVWVILEGHCDHDGSDEYNYSLGMLRATAVRRELIGAGIEAARLFLISYGEERQAVEEHSEGDKARNRRVEFRAFLAPQTVTISGSEEATGQPPENPAVPTPAPEGEEMP